MRLLLLFGFLFSTLSTPALGAVETFGDKVSVGKLFLEVPGYNLEFKSELDGKTLKYRPNVSGITGVSVTFLGMFGVTYGFRNPIADEDTIKKGKSIYDDFRFALGYDEFQFDLNFQSYKGFYLENSELADPTFSDSDPYYQDAEMKLENLSVNMTYIWSPDQFALAGTLNQTVRQTESGGSWLMGLAVANTKFYSPTGLIPTSSQASYGNDATLTEASFLSLTAKGGYGYSFIFKQYWYATLMGMFGGGVQVGSTKTATESESRQDLSYKADALVGFGYNGDTFLSGLIISLDATGYQTESIDISSQIHKINIFVGGRF